VLYEVRDSVGWITFNRPERLNAFSIELLSGATEALDEAQRDPDVRVVVLTGSGDRAFCAGGDVKRMREHIGDGRQAYPMTNHQAAVRFTLAVNAFPKPVIASLNGVAAGAGFEVALQADFRIAADNAYFKPAALNIGLVPGDGSVFFLQRLVGYAKAAEILFTERRIGSEEALSLGLVNKVVPSAALQSATAEFAELLASRAPLALQATKMALKMSISHDLATVMQYLLLSVKDTRRTEDHQEGIAALHEKRTPKFLGR
jgi:2-(1,2-epoxy-1,2-dihydrophenyl)acetyl-CoA isomerase